VSFAHYEDPVNYDLLIDGNGSLSRENYISLSLHASINFIIEVFIDTFT
jgi:hypothetical protein